MIAARINSERLGMFLMTSNRSPLTLKVMIPSFFFMDALLRTVAVYYLVILSLSSSLAQFSLSLHDRLESVIRGQHKLFRKCIAKAQSFSQGLCKTGRGVFRLHEFFCAYVRLCKNLQR